MNEATAALSAAVVVLEWSFEPADYLDEQTAQVVGKHALTNQPGRVQVRMAESVFNSDPGLKLRMHEELLRRFMGVQLASHRPFKLSGPSKVLLCPNGTRHFFVDVEEGVALRFGGAADVQVTDAHGNVLFDSKQERVTRSRSLADRYVSLGGDAVLDALMRSYAASVRDPTNELVHLYEVRDALSKQFQGQKNAEIALGLPKRLWNQLGNLCNHMPFKQGRHRGDHPGGLRDATQEELQEARSIAVAMIEGYMHHLEAERCRTAPPA